MVVAPVGYNKKVRANAKRCVVCRTFFRRRGQRKFTAKFCSIKCKGKWQEGKWRPGRPKTGKIHICEWCAKEHYRPKCYESHKYCSSKCYYEAPRHKSKGANHWNWRGGITPINDGLRKSHKYSMWRKKVFKRDKFTCQMCGQCGGQLEADHIKSFSKYPKLRFIVKNGRTLCKPCHEKTPNYKRRIM